MRVQQQEQSLRLRIDEMELARLLAGHIVENTTRWPDGRIERQQITLAAQPGWERRGDGWRLVLAEAAVCELVARRPRRDGLECAFATAGGVSLDVLFDVDVRDSARRLKEGRA